VSLYEELSACSVGETQVKYPKLLKVPEQLSIRGGRIDVQCNWRSNQTLLIVLKNGLIHDKRYLHLTDILVLQLKHITICQKLNKIQNNSCLALWKGRSLHTARVI
jgi:hypothetical protein